jgi:hypothetical protein
LFVFGVGGVGGVGGVVTEGVVTEGVDTEGIRELISDLRSDMIEVQNILGYKKSREM